MNFGPLLREHKFSIMIVEKICAPAKSGPKFNKVHYHLLPEIVLLLPNLVGCVMTKNV